MAHLNWTDRSTAQVATQYCGPAREPTSQRTLALLLAHDALHVAARNSSPAEAQAIAALAENVWAHAFPRSESLGRQTRDRDADDQAAEARQG